MCASYCLLLLLLLLLLCWDAAVLLSKDVICMPKIRRCQEFSLGQKDKGNKAVLVAQMQWFSPSVFFA